MIGSLLFGVFGGIATLAAILLMGGPLWVALLGYVLGGIAVTALATGMILFTDSILSRLARGGAESDTNRASG